MGVLGDLPSLVVVLVLCGIDAVRCVNVPFGNSSSVPVAFNLSSTANSSASILPLASSLNTDAEKTSLTASTNSEDEAISITRPSIPSSTQNASATSQAASRLSAISLAMLSGLNGTNTARLNSSSTHTSLPSPINLTTKAQNSSIPSTITSCPTTYATDYPVSWRSFEGICDIGDAAYMNPFFYSYADLCLATWCGASRWKDISAYTGPFTEYTTTTLSYFRRYVSTFTVNGTRSKSTTIESTLETAYNVRLKGASELVKWNAPCCGQCSMTVLSMHLIYWPDQATRTTDVEFIKETSSTPKSIVDEAGFTFVSPSIYIAFTSLSAWDECGILGERDYTTTIAFDLSEINTYTSFIRTTCYNLTGTPYFTQLPTVTQSPVLTRITRPLTISDLEQDCATTPGYYYNPADPDQSYYNDDPCHPYIEVPTKVKAIHPSWSPCLPAFGGGFYDPPKTLQQGGVLVPTTRPNVTPKIPPTPGQSLPDIPLPTENSPEPTRGTSPASFPDPVPAPNPAPRPAEPILQPSGTRRDDGSMITVVLPAGPNFPPAEERPPTQNLPVNNPIIPASPIVIPLQPATASRPALPLQSGDPNQSRMTHEEQPLPTTELTLLPTFVSDNFVLIVDGTQTLAPGSEIIVDGRRVSLFTTGGSLIIDQSLVTLDVLNRAPITQAPPSLPLQELIFTINGAGETIIRGQTLRPDSRITIGGTTVTLSNGAVTVSEGTIATLISNTMVFVVDGTTIVPASGKTREGNAQATPASQQTRNVSAQGGSRSSSGPEMTGTHVPVTGEAAKSSAGLLYAVVAAVFGVWNAWEI